MTRNDGLELSPKKSEYLKYILEKGGIVRTMDISDNFHLDRQQLLRPYRRCLPLAL